MVTVVLFLWVCTVLLRLPSCCEFNVSAQKCEEADHSSFSFVLFLISQKQMNWSWSSQCFTPAVNSVCVSPAGDPAFMFVLQTGHLFYLLASLASQTLVFTVKWLWLWKRHDRMIFKNSCRMEKQVYYSVIIIWIGMIFINKVNDGRKRFLFTRKPFISLLSLGDIRSAFVKTKQMTMLNNTRWY